MKSCLYKLCIIHETGFIYTLQHASSLALMITAVITLEYHSRSAACMNQACSIQCMHAVHDGIHQAPHSTAYNPCRMHASSYFSLILPLSQCIIHTAMETWLVDVDAEPIFVAVWSLAIVLLASWWPMKFKKICRTHSDFLIQTGVTDNSVCYIKILRMN